MRGGVRTRVGTGSGGIISGFRELFRRVISAFDDPRPIQVQAQRFHCMLQPVLADERLYPVLRRGAPVRTDPGLPLLRPEGRALVSALHGGGDLSQGEGVGAAGILKAGASGQRLLHGYAVGAEGACQLEQAGIALAGHDGVPSLGPL